MALYPIPSMALCPLYGLLSPSTALCLLYVPLFPLLPLSSLLPSVPFLDLCPLCGPLSPSTALCPLYSPLSPLRPPFPSTAICLFYGPLSPLRPSVSSLSLCPLYGPLPLCVLLPPPCDPLSNLDTLHGPLSHLRPPSPLRPSVPFTRHVISHCFTVSQNAFRPKWPLCEKTKQANQSPLFRET
jgi:hypothetical protein